MSEHITHTPQIKRLERARDDRILAGVCSGLGRYFDLNPSVFRLGLIVLTLLGGAGILVYLAAVLVLPEEGGESIAERILSQRRDRPWPVVGLGMVAVALAVLLSRADIWPAAGAGWLLLLIGGLVILWTSRRRRVFAVLVTLLALFVAAVVTSVAVAFSWFDVSLGNGVGGRTYQPAALTDLQRTYQVGVGNMVLDLSRIGTVTHKTELKASVGVGKLKVIVPRGANVAVDARVKAGSIDALGRHNDGTDAHVQVGDSGRLVVDARVGAGHIDVVRAQ
jgi:phage shock protein PspC (stress-responsive transcriptional regulator)/predicted membrane protein